MMIRLKNKPIRSDTNEGINIKD